MADLEILRPEVRESLERLSDSISDAAYAAPENENGDRTALQAIRTELLRLDALARELNEERGRQAALRFDERIRAEKAEAELAALRHENAQLHDVLADRDMDRGMAAHANRELAALKARIAASRLIEPGIQFSVPGYAGKRVRLVVEE